MIHCLQLSGVKYLNANDEKCSSFQILRPFALTPLLLLNLVNGRWMIRIPLLIVLDQWHFNEQQ